MSLGPLEQMTQAGLPTCPNDSHGKSELGRMLAGGRYYLG